MKKMTQKKIRTKNHKSTTTHKQQKLSFHSPAAASSLQSPPSSSLMFLSPSWAHLSICKMGPVIFTATRSKHIPLQQLCLHHWDLLSPGCLNQETSNIPCCWLGSLGTYFFYLAFEFCILFFCPLFLF